ncbi:MAG: segregation and condensation protein B [Pseudohongiellaceae bacterium]|jgi:segregation and condensation protein B
MSDVDNKVKMIVEGLLLAAGRPLTLDAIGQIFAEDEMPDNSELQAVMAAIDKSCNDRGFELKETASGFRFQVKQELSEWIGKLWEERPPRYTRALLETLALVAYRQPLTRGDIEEIRGVGVSSNIVRTLLDREWIRVVGHRDVPGRPAMFATTRQFLDYFNLKSLQELPPLADIKDLVEKSTELDLEDGLADARVLDLPEDVNDENAFESHQSEAEKLAEEAAFALSKKPLDEILAEGLGIPEHEIEDDDDEVHEEIAEEETHQEADLKVTTNEIQNDQQDAEIEVPEKSDENDLEQTDEFSERLEASLDPDIDDSDLDDEANPVKK